MIGWLRGEIVDKHEPGKLVMNVQGVGYDVETSLNTFFQLEDNVAPITLHIHTVVREDALLLYGFADKEERSLFRALIKVNGIGPKMAMTILSSISPVEFIRCIQEGQSDRLVKLPGIGKKTAERLIIELRDAIKNMDGGPIKVNLSTLYPPSFADEAISALESLGYKSQEAQKTVTKIDDGQKSCEQLIRESLQILAQR